MSRADATDPGVDPASPVFGEDGRMRETELWQRLAEHLGASYCRVWAAEYNLAELGNRTVEQAIADGYAFRDVWRAVWAALELPPRDR